MEVKSKQITTTEVIAAGESYTSSTLDLGTKYPEGYFSFQIVLTGDGIAQVTYLQSNDGTNFITPEEAENIVTSFSATSGPNGDGIGMYSFSPMVSKHIKIKIEEVNGVNPITVTSVIAYQ